MGANCGRSLGFRGDQDSVGAAHGNRLPGFPRFSILTGLLKPASLTILTDPITSGGPTPLPLIHTGKSRHKKGSPSVDREPKQRVCWFNRPTYRITYGIRHDVSIQPLERIRPQFGGGRAGDIEQQSFIVLLLNPLLFCYSGE